MNRVFRSCIRGWGNFLQITIRTNSVLFPYHIWLVPAYLPTQEEIWWIAYHSHFQSMNLLLARFVWTRSWLAGCAKPAQLFEVAPNFSVETSGDNTVRRAAAGGVLLFLIRASIRLQSQAIHSEQIMHFVGAQYVDELGNWIIRTFLWFYKYFIFL